MNLIEQSPPAIVILLSLLLLAGGIHDGVRMRISNFISLAMLLLFGAGSLVVGIDWSIWENLAVFAGLLVAGTLLYGTGKFGGGDVKFLAVTGIWFNLIGSLQLLAAVFILGGILALLIVGIRMTALGDRNSSIVLLRRGAGIPYGLAIAGGGLLTIALLRLS